MSCNQLEIQQSQIVRAIAADIDVVVSEVGPRDGLQIVDRIMPTNAKWEWIKALAASGIPEIEVGSFVPAKLLPQMADAASIVAAASKLSGITVLALVPNLKGAEHAIASGAHTLTMPVSASRLHCQANLRKTPEQAVEEVRRVCAYRAAFRATREIAIEANVSTAFGCSMEGAIPEDRVIELALMLAEAGADSVGLSDTIGYANPAQTKRLFTRLNRELGDLAGSAHFHNTRGLGLANVVAALDAGVVTIDASQAGIGGCPYASGASGNIVTEDLVFMLESMGLRTGIDITKLIAARKILAGALPGEPLYGHVAEVGLPNYFEPVSGK
jgi:hydroxymethylglutaryl-CoA lyase